jgi:hypothetical protein
MTTNSERLKRLWKTGGGRLVIVGAIAGAGAGLIVGSAVLGVLVGGAAGYAAEIANKKKS